MEIQNNKEEIPFSYYADLLSKADPAEITARTGIPCENGTFRITLLGNEYAIKRPPCVKGAPPQAVGDCHNPSVSYADTSPYTGDTIPIPTQTFLIRYLLEGKSVLNSGTWKTFREMPWGELYIKPYTGRVLTRAAFTFGTRLAAFRAACEKMGATAIPNGDAGYEFSFIGDYKVRILVWEGDDEFPPNAQILYSDNFAEGFAAEDRVVAGDILIGTIKSYM